jgi:hypothetical protein
MGMGESGHQEPPIPARPRWPVDAVSYCASADSSLKQVLMDITASWAVSDRVVDQLR